MPSDLIAIISCSVLGLMAHGARTRKWLEWMLRIIIGTFFMFSGIAYLSGIMTSGSPWYYQITGSMGLACLFLLFLPFRQVMSRVLTVVDGIVSLRCLSGPMRHKISAWASIINIQVFQPRSIPHMVGTFCYIATFGMYLANTNPAGFDFPQLLPGVAIVPEQLFSYNGFGLVLMSVCGVGILVSRKPREAFARLGWSKPTMTQVGIGLGLVVFSFLYDLCWSLYTHQTGDMASKISAYNATTFAAPAGSGGFGYSVFLALAAALCAGIGEETLMRGAIQPVLGILPAALLHGILHAQFSNAPTLILQVALWSCVMGIVRRCTNTTTTIIGHAGFNFVTTFLFAFNP